MSSNVKMTKYNGKKEKKIEQGKGLRSVGLGRGLQNELRILGWGWSVCEGVT